MKGSVILIAAVVLVAGQAAPGWCGKVYVGADTKIEVLLKTPITTSEDQPRELTALLEIAKSDTVAGVEVFRKGGKVFGEILEFTPPGHLGKPGFLRIRIDSLQTVQGRNIPVKPMAFSSSGKAKKLKAYLMLPLLGYGYFVKGGHASLGEAGQIIPVRTTRFEELSF